MLRCLGIVFSLMAIMAASHLHLGITQLVAWGTMLNDYSEQTDDIREVFDMTFGGEFPCELCRTVKASMPAKDTDDRTSFENIGKIVLLTAVRTCFEIIRRSNSLGYSGNSQDADEKHYPCDLPPPRLV